MDDFFFYIKRFLNWEESNKYVFLKVNYMEIGFIER